MGGAQPRLPGVRGQDPQRPRDPARDPDDRAGAGLATARLARPPAARPRARLAGAAAVAAGPDHRPGGTGPRSRHRSRSRSRSGSGSGRRARCRPGGRSRLGPPPSARRRSAPGAPPAAPGLGPRRTAEHHRRRHAAGRSGLRLGWPVRPCRLRCSDRSGRCRYASPRHAGCRRDGRRDGRRSRGRRGRRRCRSAGTCRCRRRCRRCAGRSGRRGVRAREPFGTCGHRGRRRQGQPAGVRPREGRPGPRAGAARGASAGAAGSAGDGARTGRRRRATTCSAPTTTGSTTRGPRPTSCAEARRVPPSVGRGDLA